MIDFSPRKSHIGLLVAFLFALPGFTVLSAQQVDSAAVVQMVDAAVKSRTESIAGYTVTEHYTVYRNQDETHSVAEMVVNTSYRKDTGKSYAITSQSGSELVRSVVLGAILDREKRLSQPGVREGLWFTSANYEMKLHSGGPQLLDGRNCFVLSLTPRRKTSNLIDGMLWVDAKDGSIVQVQGTASKSSSIFASPTQVIRQYAMVSGFPQAIHARALSSISMLGKILVKIDYQNYVIQFRPAT